MAHISTPDSDAERQRANLHVLMSGRPERFQPRMATPAPMCPHGTAYAQPCYSCGWTCPACKRSYAPWVRECNYRHENKEPASLSGQYPLNVPASVPEFATMSLRLPPQWSQVGYQHLVRASGEWRDMLPGLQVLLGQPVNGGEEAVLHFRLTPDVWADDHA